MSQQQVSWICLLPLIPSISLFSCIVYQFSLASIAKSSACSHHTCHHVGWWSLSTELLLLRLLSVRVSPTDQYSVLLYFFSTLLLLVLSYLTHPPVIICMLMTINFSFFYLRAQLCWLSMSMYILLLWNQSWENNLTLFTILYCGILLRAQV